MFATELRHAARRLMRAPAFALTSLLALTLGVGGVVTLFALLDAALLRPLPFPNGGRLVAVVHDAPRLGLHEAGLGYGSFAHYRSGSALADLAIWHEAAVNVGGAGEPERRALVMASASFFDVLGLRPAHGRLFVAEDGLAGTTPHIVLGHEYWARAFGADPDVVGRTILINERPRLIIGVLERGASYPRPDVQLFMNAPEDPGERRFDAFPRNALGLLPPGVTAVAATAALQARSASLGDAVPDAPPPGVLRVSARPLAPYLARDAAPALRLALAAMVLVLIVAVANVSSLAVARGEQARREITIRSALGAGTRALLARFAADAALLAGAGTLLGLMAASWTLPLVAQFPGSAIPASAHPPRLHGAVLLAGCAVGATVALVLLALSSLRFLRADPAAFDALRSLSDRPGGNRARRVLVAAQLAFSLALLGSAGLLGRSFLRLTTVDPGFDATATLTFEVRLPFARFRDGAAEAFHAALLERLRGIPGVVSAGATTGLPLTAAAGTLEYRVEVEGAVAFPEDPVRFVLVTPGYFETMRIPHVSGWTPGETAVGDARRRVIVSATLARSLGGDAALDRRLRRVVPGRTPGEWLTVAGIAGDVRDRGLATGPGAIVYVPVLDATTDPGFSPDLVSFAVRTTADPVQLVAAARAALHEVDANIPLAGIRTLDDIVTATTERTRFAALLVLAAGVLATALGLLGVWGVVAWAVTTRRREFAIRIALGARGREVDSLVLGDIARVAALGLLCGALPALALSWWLRALLFATRPFEPAAWALAALALFGGTLLAAWLPARRAGRTDPARVLAGD
jgi:putative ABC transport system permease protein